jgi:hypothetical protein
MNTEMIRFLLGLAFCVGCTNDVTGVELDVMMAIPPPCPACRCHEVPIEDTSFVDTGEPLTFVEPGTGRLIDWRSFWRGAEVPVFVDTIITRTAIEVCVP